MLFGKKDLIDWITDTNVKKLIAEHTLFNGRYVELENQVSSSRGFRIESERRKNRPSVIEITEIHIFGRTPMYYTIPGVILFVAIFFAIFIVDLRHLWVRFHGAL